MNSPAPANRARSSALIVRLAPLLISSILLYAVLVPSMLLAQWLPRGRVTIGTITNKSFEGALTLAITGCALYALYAVGVLLLWRGTADRRVTWIVWSGAGVAAALLLLVYPVTSTDVFDYFFRSHMALDFGANPYLDLPNSFKGDRSFRYVGWPNAPSAYGPLWEILSLALVALSRGSLLNATLLYKLLAIATHFAIGAVLWRMIEPPRLRIAAVYLWLWQPLALWEFAANAHNDGLLILSLLLALWAAQRKHFAWAVLALTAGALIKFLPAVFLPLVALAWMRQQPTWIRRVRVLGVALLLSLVPTIALYALYWDVPPAFAQLAPGAQLAAIWQGRTTTLRNLTVREGFLNASPWAVVSYWLREPPSVARINGVLQSLGFAATDANGIRKTISALGTTLLGVGLIWQCWHVWFRRRLHVAFFGLIVWYLLATSQWFQPWYVLWLLPLAILDLRRDRLGWLTAWAVAAQASYVLQYIVLPNARINGQTLQAQIYYVEVVYLLPLAVWLVFKLRPRRGPRSDHPRRTLAPSP